MRMPSQPEQSRAEKGGIERMTRKATIEVAPGYTVQYIEQFYPRAEADAALRALLRIETTPEVDGGKAKESA